MAGTKPHTMLAGIIAFFMTEVVALATAVVGGSIIDIVEVQLVQAGMVDVPAEWSPDAYKLLINIFYVMPYVISLLGLFILFVTIYQRYGIDQEEEEYEEDEYGNKIYYNGGAL